MTEVQQRRVTRLIIGNRKFQPGTDEVREIEVAPPVARIWYNNGTALDIFFPHETAYWYHEEKPDIIVPQIVLRDEVK